MKGKMNLLLGNELNVKGGEELLIQFSIQTSLLERKQLKDNAATSLCKNNYQLSILMRNLCGFLISIF